MTYRKSPVCPTHPPTGVPSKEAAIEIDSIPFGSPSSSALGCCDQDSGLCAFVEHDLHVDPFTDPQVFECSDLDVLSGRGKSNLKHPGNQKYQDLINENAERYVAEQNNHEKRNIQAAIIQAVEQTGGKFLKPCKTDARMWQRVPFEETRQKVAHALQYRVRVCREDSSAGGAVALITPSSSPSNEKVSRKRVAGAAAERNGRSTRKKNTGGRTAAARRPSGSPRRVSMEQPPAMVASSDLRQPSPHEQQQQQQGIEEYHGGCFGGPQGYGHYNLQQQQRRHDGDFARAHLPDNGDRFDDSSYHPYRYHLSVRADHDRHHDHNGSDFLPITSAAAAPETLPFDAFNAGLTVIPIFDGSSDSDDSLEFYHWPSVRHHHQHDE